MQERLQKILAHAGIASRRKAEEIITEGRVTVNGKVVTELGTRADAASDGIRVDGKRIHLSFSLLFRTVAETLREVARNSKHLGAEIGFFGILHTWGQNVSPRISDQR